MFVLKKRVIEIEQTRGGFPAIKWRAKVQNHWNVIALLSLKVRFARDTSAVMHAQLRIAQFEFEITPAAVRLPRSDARADGTTFDPAIV